MIHTQQPRLIVTNLPKISQHISPLNTEGHNTFSNFSTKHSRNHPLLAPWFTSKKNTKYS